MKITPHFTRRTFLKALAASGAALVIEPLLVACGGRRTPTVTAPPAALPTQPGIAPAAPAGPLQPGVQPTASPDQPVPCLVDGPTPCAPAAPTPTPASAAAEPAQPGLTQADLAVIHGDVTRESELALEMVTRLLQPLGGIERFIPVGGRVVIKPNICTGYYTYEYAATTNPYVIGALVSLCLGAGAKRVQVMDFPFGGSAQRAYVKSGIQEQVEAAGGEMVMMSAMKYIQADLPEGVDIRQWSIYEDILSADALINVPIAKHHSLARLTLGMKNLMGTTLDRQGLHRNLGQRLADLTSRIRPTLTVIDAMRMLMANGPTGGNLSDVQAQGTLIASPDIVAADSYASTLFGLQPADLAYVQAATAMGLGQSNLSELKIEEFNL